MLSRKDDINVVAIHSNSKQSFQMKTESVFCTECLKWLTEPL